MKKQLSIVGILLILVAILFGVTGCGNGNESQNTTKKKVYYEYKGTSSVDRESTIYSDDNDNWTIITKYFNCGKEKEVTKKITKNQKDEILKKINENSNSTNLSTHAPALDDGGSSYYSIEYINTESGKEITPVDLENLGYVKSVDDVL